MKLSQLSVNQRFLLAVISGVTVYPVSYLEKYNSAVIPGFSLIDILIGAVFALLVMVPFLKSFNVLKAAFMVISSIGIYRLVSELAVTRYHAFYMNLEYFWGIIVSGGLGAVLTALAIQLITPLKYKKHGYYLILGSGLFGGLIFTTTFDSQSALINTVGFVIWQSFIFVGMYLSRKT